MSSNEETKSEVSQDSDPFKRDEKGRLLPGHKGGPGRPKGKTIKEMVREWLDNNPEDMRAFVKHFVKENKELAWQMLEGRPQQDVTSDGKALPTPILNVLRSNNSDKEDSEPSKEN